MKGSRLVVLAALVALIALFFGLGLDRYFEFEYLKTQQAVFENAIEASPLTAGAIFFATYVAVAGLSLPGAAVMTLLGGALFGLGYGLVLVSFASAIGATIAFLIARYLFRDAVARRFPERMRAINSGVEREGAFYLLTLRLVPLFPFFVINIVMGLTAIQARTFYVVSQLGMLPGATVFVNAGTQLAAIESPGDVLSPALLASFAALGIFPLVAKRAVDAWRKRRAFAGYKRPAGFDRNIIVVGAGSAGLVAAYIAAAVKAKVTLIEKHRMGGDCLNTGCVPSKALLKSAKLAQQMRQASDLGVASVEPDIDFAMVMERVQGVIRTIEPHDSVERYTDLGVECLTGQGRIVSPWEVEVDGRRLSARNIIVAAGAAPLVPPIPGLETVDAFTSDTVWSLRERPARMVVLGGGPIGCELAQAFARLGSRVTLIEMAPRLLPREDAVVAELMAERFRDEGIELLLGYRAVRFERGDGANVVHCTGDDDDDGDDDERTVTFDAVLLALGRRANTTGYGLEELGVAIDPGGTIAHDDFLQTNIPSIYVCGDVAGPYQFTHTASHQAWYATVNSLFGPYRRFRANYRVIPWCTFTDPEVARCGLSEAEATERGVAFELTEYSLAGLDRAVAEGDRVGFVRVLTPPGRDRILGVTIVGSHAGEMLAEFVLAMTHGLGLGKIMGTVHTYPTLSEAAKLTAGQWRRAHAPEAALSWLQRFHVWRRR